jgi:peptide/nickel transport system permease protein
VTAYIVRRLIQAIPVLIGISIVVFGMTRMIPGDAVDMMIGIEGQVSEERRQEMRALFGFDEPLHIQYLNWAGGVLTGNMGVSLRTSQPVDFEIANRLPVTFQLTLLSMVFAVLIAIPAGIIAAIRTGTRTEAGVQTFSLLGLATPNFFLGTLLILFTSRTFGWFPSASYVPITEDPWRNIQIFILPAIALGAAISAMITRMTRSSMLEVMGREFIVTARAKGLVERVVIMRHALKNALIPVVTVVGVQTGQLLGGVIIIEEVFNLPGIGRLAVQSIQQRDYPVIQGVVLFVAVAFVLINLFVDVLYAYIDPRIRYN